MEARTYREVRSGSSLPMLRMTIGSYDLWRKPVMVCRRASTPAHLLFCLALFAWINDSLIQPAYPVSLLRDTTLGWTMQRYGSL